VTLHQVERIFAYACLLFLTSAFFRILAGEHTAPEGDSLITLVAAAFFYLGAALVLARNFGAFTHLIRANLPIVMLLALVLISLAWSLDPALTLRRAIASTGSTLIAYAVVVKLSADEFHEATIWALGVVAVLSMLTVIIVPSFGIHQANDPEAAQHAGSWRGMYSHKNGLGRLMAPMTALLIVCAPPRLPMAVRIVFLITGLALTLGSTSKQAIILLTLMVLAYPLIQYLQRQNALVLGVMLSFGLSLGAVSMLLYEPIAGTVLGWMGRDLSLTGRTDLWAVGIGETLEDQPLLGSGFAVGWSGRILAILSRDIGHAHNGYVALFVDLGFVGIGVFLMVAAQVVIRYFKLRYWMQPRIFIFFGLLLFYFFVINLVSSEILRRNDMPWILFVIATLYISHGATTLARPAWVPVSLPRRPHASA
jgi:exopolysaccharide production protein ExoQ